MGTNIVINKSIKSGDDFQDKITNQKKSWSQIRYEMVMDINKETYSYEFVNFVFKIKF